MGAKAIRQQIDAMSEEERFFASAYLQHLANEHDDERKARLAARMKRMDQGRHFTLDQAHQIDQSLATNGL